MMRRPLADWSKVLYALAVAGLFACSHGGGGGAAAGFEVTPTAGLTTSESGGNASFAVVLTRAPSADVTIAVTSSNALEGAPSVASLTFTPADWDTEQTVTVAGGDDSVADGDAGYSIFLAAAASADAAYDGLEVPDVSLVNGDDDVAGVGVAPSGLQTNENLTTADFTVVLGSQPFADVTIAIMVGDPLEGSVSSSSLLFTAADWNLPQTVTVTGLDDFAADGPAGYTVFVGPVSSADAAYAAIDPSDVSITNQDNDTPGFTVTDSGLQTTEPGGTDDFTVVLNSQPAPGTLVRVQVTSSDPAEGTVPAAPLDFDDTNWSVAQSVTITGVNDAFPAVDGDATYTILVDVDAGATTDAAYAALDPGDIAVVNLDDDVAGITTTPLVLTTTEGGAVATFTVALDSVPGGSVSIDLSSDDTSEGGAAPGMIVFPADPGALAPVTVTVTPADDLLVDGARSYSVVLDPATSSDPDYSGLDPADVAVTNGDNDTGGFSVLPTTLTTNESGVTGSFDVVLTSIPAADVSTTITSGDSSEGLLALGANPPSVSVVLTFTAGTALTPQTVTVVPVDDALVDGSVPYTIVTAPAASTDPTYAGLDPDDVSATNSDDEVSVPGAAGWARSMLSAALATGAAGAWDEASVSEPSVILLGPAALELWYEGANAAGQKHEQVGRATSPDGAVWSKSPATPVFSHSAINGTFDRNGVGDPVVVFDGASYSMWYAARSTAPTKTKIGLATSPDGITWTRSPSNPVLVGTAGQWDASGVTSPHVLLDGATYRMWYSGTDSSGILRLGYATSADGVSWSKSAAPVLTPGAAGQFDAAGVSLACVIKDGAVYRMWYTGLDSTGRQRIGFAQSADGVSWSKYPGNPIVGLGATGAFDAAGVLSPFVIKDGAVFRMWYTGKDATGKFRIGYATNP